MNPSNPPAMKAMDMRWLRWGLAAIAFLLTIIAVELSVLIGPTQPRAWGQAADCSSQRSQPIEGGKPANHTTQPAGDHPRTGEIKVNGGGTDKEAKGAPAPASHTSKSAARSRGAAPRTR